MQQDENTWYIYHTHILYIHINILVHEYWYKMSLNWGDDKRWVHMMKIGSHG